MTLYCLRHRECRLDSGDSDAKGNELCGNGERHRGRTRVPHRHSHRVVAARDRDRVRSLAGILVREEERDLGANNRGILVVTIREHASSIQSITQQCVETHMPPTPSRLKDMAEEAREKTLNCTPGTPQSSLQPLPSRVHRTMP